MSNESSVLFCPLPVDTRLACIRAESEIYWMDSESPPRPPLPLASPSQGGMYALSVCGPYRRWYCSVPVGIIRTSVLAPTRPSVCPCVKYLLEVPVTKILIRSFHRACSTVISSAPASQQSTVTIVHEEISFYHPMFCTVGKKHAPDM